MNITVAQSRATSRLTRGYLIGLLGTVFWAFTGVLIRFLTENFHIPPLVLAFWRDFFMPLSVAMALLLLKPQLLRLGRHNMLFFVAYGLVVSLFNSLWTTSVALNGAAVSTVLAYSSAAFTAILGWLLLREELGLVKIIAVILSLVGCIFVSGAYSPTAWRVNALGLFTGLVSGIAFAAYSLMGRVAAKRGINPWTTLLYSFAFADIFILAYNFIPLGLPEGLASTNLLWLGSSLVGWGVLLLLAVIPTAGGFGLYMVALTYLPASVANLIATLEPAITAVLAYLLLGELFTPPQWVGSVFIMSGVIALRLSEGREGSAG